MRKGNPVKASLNLTPATPLFLQRAGFFGTFDISEIYISYLYK